MNSHATILNGVPLGLQSRMEWLTLTAQDLRGKFIRKYEAGQAEHKSDLGSVSLKELLREIEQEALDQLAYVNELQRRVVAMDGHVVIDRSTLSRLIRASESVALSVTGKGVIYAESLSDLNLAIIEAERVLTKTNNGK